MSVPPQPSRIVPQFLPWAAQVVGVQVQPAMGVPTHAPAAHVSAEVQGLPSLQGRLTGVWTQPIEAETVVEPDADTVVENSS